MKSTTAFFKDLDTKFGTVNYSTDICIIAIEQNTFYSMAASVVEIYIQENQQQENLHLEAAPRADLENDALTIKAKFMENACEGAHSSAKLQARSLPCTKIEASHSHPPRILPRS